MPGVIITGHGQFASGMKNSLEMLIGPQDFLRSVDFLDNHSEDILKENLQKAYDSIVNKDAVFVLCDILGGSPFKNSVTNFFGNENVHILYGVNLGMAIELCMKCMVFDSDSSEGQIADEIVEAGKSGIGKFQYEAPEAHDDLDDGI